ncbi:MAG TPA: hypothetical protein VLG76_02465 [Rhabdochlamydiaceae bacterium]|nr:hypothetical protein [Rhabdochlamydiaceae bacterium]
MNNFVIKPSELSTINLPYLDVAVETILSPFLASKLITIITTYADISKKVDTQKMISIFLNGIPGQFSPLPKAFIEVAKKAFPDCSTCLDKSLQASVQPLKDATILGDNDERKLMILTRLYFCHKTKQDEAEIKIKHLNVDSAFLEEVREYNRNESREFTNKIVGIDIVERCNYITDKRRCHSYVFGQEPWFTGEHLLFGSPDLVLTHLKSKNLNLVAKAVPKAIVIYCRPNKVTHYGRVESVDSEGNITVVSKFGEQNIYRHRPELVPYIYGTQVFFLVKV